MRKLLIILLICLLPFIAFADVDTFDGQTGIDTWDGQTGVDTIDGQTIGGGDSALWGKVTECWDFNDSDVGSKVGHDLTANGDPTYGTTTPPEGSKYVELDGDDWFNIADHADFDLTGDYSISMWVKSDGTADGFLGKGTADAAGGGYQIYSTYIADDDVLRVAHYYGNWSTENEDTALGMDDIAAVWVHIVITFDDSDTSTALQVWASPAVGVGAFGSIYNATFDMDNPPADRGYDLTIGDSLAKDPFGDEMDEVCIFKGEVLSAAEAEDIWDGNWR